jgi:hypothetical protein
MILEAASAPGGGQASKVGECAGGVDAGPGANPTFGCGHVVANVNQLTLTNSAG